MMDFVQAKIDGWKDSHTSLQHLRGKNANISQEAAEIRVTFQKS
jgi:hypothetical protein